MNQPISALIHIERTHTIMRRKSAAEKLATGTYRPERDRKSPQFVAATGIASKPPTYLKSNKLAMEEWKRVAPYLEAEGILKETDVSLLASYCVLYSRWREAAAEVEKNGQVITITSTTRTGRTEKLAANPSVRNEILYQSAMMRSAVKFGLNPLDRPRVEASPFEHDEDNYNDGLDSDLREYGVLNEN
jgi:P27 family predicted phage terminase small subunit